MYPFHGSSSSSFSPSVSLLCQLMEGEKQEAKKWLSVEMNRLVEPLINGLVQQITTRLTAAEKRNQPGDYGFYVQGRDMFHQAHNAQVHSSQVYSSMHPQQMNPPQMYPPQMHPHQMYPPQQYQLDQANLHTTQQLHNSTLPFADGHLQSNQASNANSNGLANGLVQQPLTTNLTTAQEPRKSGDYEERVQEGDKFHSENPSQGQNHEYQLDQTNLNTTNHNLEHNVAAAVQLSNQSPNVQVNPVKEAQNASWLSAQASYNQSPIVQVNPNEIDYLENEPLNQTSHEPITDQAPPSPSWSSASTIIEQSNLANENVENKNYGMYGNDTRHYDDHHQSNEPVPSSDRDTAQVDEETEVKDNGDDGDNVIEVIDRDEHEPSPPKRGRPKKNPQPRNLKPNPDKQIIVLSLKCFQCTQMFDNKSKLNAHLHNQHKMFPNRCLVKDCRQSFCTSTLLNKHTKQDHSNITRWQCSKCPKFYTTNQALTSHDYQIHQFGRFQCALPNCEFTGKTRKPLYDHLKKMHQQNINAALFMCEHPGCGRGFRELAKLKKHLQDAVHYGDANEKPYRCKWLTCVYASDDRAATIEHIKRLHFRLDESSPTYENDQLAEKYLEVVGGAPDDDDDDENDQPSNGRIDDSARVELIEVEEDGDYDGNDVIEEPSRPTKRPRLDTTESPNNGQSNSTNLQLTRPEATTNIPQKRVDNQKLITLSLDCLQSDCPLKFNGKFELNAHMSSVHHILQSRCLVKGCHQSFNTFRVPSNHFTQDHSNIKKNEWPCDKCPKLCISSHRLSIHDYTFHQHGHFQCAYPNCDFTGTNRQKVYVHVNLQHKMSKFKCEQPGCTLEFSGIARLKKHQQEANHHGDPSKKPYRCKWLSCDYASAERDATIEHIKRMHFLLLDPQSSPKEDALAMKYLEVLQRPS